MIDLGSLRSGVWVIDLNKSTAHILLIDDDPAVAKVVRVLLSDLGFRVTVEHRGEWGLERMKERAPDLLILDINLPGMNGLVVCREARAFYDGPILFLTVRDSTVDEVTGLELGGDDYLSKPFDPKVLVARVQALLRRAENPWPIPPFSIDRLARTASLNKVRLDLTPLEFDLLSSLEYRFGESVPRQYLLSEVWGEGYIGDRRVVDVHIRHLRKKMRAVAGSPSIATVRGVGYRLE